MLLPPLRRRLRARSAFAAVAVAAAIGLLAGCSPEPAPAANDGALSGEVVWADYGGPTNESRQIAYFDSFADETGVDVVSASFEDAVGFEMLEGGEGDYDLIQVSTDSLLRYRDNLVSLPADAPRGDNLPEEIRDYAIGGFIIGITQGWLTETFPDGGPEDWADFFDTEAYPGKRAWPGSAGSYDASYEIALLADGVAPEDLYPLDLQRATAKLDSIRDDLVFYSSYPEVQTLLSSGSASIAVSVTGQFTALQNSGLDVTVQWDQAFLSPNFFVIPNTAKHRDNALALAGWLADPERQSVFTERTLYGPADTATFELLDDATISALPNAPEHTDVLSFDEQWRADHLDELTAQYADWLAG
jgi:putative spermidine/putrescine transport system substrate-binding protein